MIASPPGLSYDTCVAADLPGSSLGSSASEAGPPEPAAASPASPVSRASSLAPPPSSPGGKAGSMYYAAPPPDAKSRTLRLYVSAADLFEMGPRFRGACAVVYLRSSGAVRAQLSNVTAGSADGAAPPSPPAAPAARKRESRTFVGQTEAAALHGRDAEFARTFRVPYAAGSAAVVHVDMYACAAGDTSRNALLGVAEVPLARVAAARGARVSSPIVFVATASERDRKRKGGSAGTLQIAAEDVSAGLRDFRLDLQCEQMKRAKPFGSGRVRRAHYTVHTIASRDPACEDWSLLFRSAPVEMVKKKRDGGSMEYNYFSSRPLIAAPGVIVADDAPDPPGSPLARVAHRVRARRAALFFSLPSCALACVSPDRRLKLSLFDSSGSAFDLIADTEFTITQLRNMNLGDTADVQINNNHVGSAALKFVECGDDPSYFCLSIMMPHLK